MAEGQTPDLSAILKTVSQNPEMLTQAMQMAESLKDSGLLSGILSRQKDEKQDTEERAEPTGRETGGNEKPPGNSRYQRHHALLLALRPYLSEERKERVDLLIRLLGILNAADQMGLSKWMEGNFHV